MHLHIPNVSALIYTKFHRKDLFCFDCLTVTIVLRVAQGNFYHPLLHICKGH